MTAEQKCKKIDELFEKLGCWHPGKLPVAKIDWYDKITDIVIYAFLAQEVDGLGHEDEQFIRDMMSEIGSEGEPVDYE